MRLSCFSLSHLQSLSCGSLIFGSRGIPWPEDWLHFLREPHYRFRLHSGFQERRQESAVSRVGCCWLTPRRSISSSEALPISNRSGLSGGSTVFFLEARYSPPSMASWTSFGRSLCHIQPPTSSSGWREPLFAALKVLSTNLRTLQISADSFSSPPPQLFWAAESAIWDCHVRCL